jgi:hypothetical protein
MTDAVDYDLYGLTRGNPYVNRPLDPGYEVDRPLFLPLEVLPPEDVITAHIARTATAGGSTAFLLSGRSGAGRTSLAHKIMHLYREARGIGDTFHIVRYKKVDHNSFTRVSEIIKDIRNEVCRKHMNRWDELTQRIPDRDDRDLTRLDLQTRADYLAFVMQNVKPAMHFALLIDGIQDDAFMDTLAVVFRYVPAVVVVTRNAYDTADTVSAQRLSERPEWQEWAMHLELRPLTGPDVERITVNRWAAAAGDLVCPFDLVGVRHSFNQRSKPMGHAIQLLGWLLEGRLRQYEGNEPWPAATELHLPAKWIEWMMQRGESAP